MGGFITEKIFLLVISTTKPRKLNLCSDLGENSISSLIAQLTIFLNRHGLSYTKFSCDRFSITPVTSHDELFGVTLFLTIRNVGSVSGSKVVQAYVEFPDVGVTIPPLQLKGFAKARDVPPGGSQELIITLDKYAISFWDSERGAWNAPAGKYRVFLGYQCNELETSGEFELQKSFYWSGL
jgi:beta-glucosidase